VAKNKLRKFAEMDSYPHVIQASFEEVFRNDYKLKGKWSNDFFNNDNPIVLELGCGKGEYTVGLAQKYPNKNFIGMDIKGFRMHTGATESLNLGLKNVAFIRSQVEFIDSFFAKDEISEIWLTFPDPQMNRARRRLSGTRHLNQYAEVLKKDGLIHLKTDSNFLYTYTRELALHNELEIVSDFDDLYNSNFVDDILSIKTYYESRFLEHNIPIKYFSFYLNGRNDLTEPEVDIPLDEYRNTGMRVRFGNEE